MKQRRSEVGLSLGSPYMKTGVDRAVAVTLAAAILGARALTGTPAAAADQQAPTSVPAAATAGTQSQANLGQLQEVVVTAERRQENLQTTAISATVLNANNLVQKGVVQLQDLQNASPSLTIMPAGLTSSVNIRGIGLDSGSPAVVPGIAFYRDGLWQPPINITDTLYDVASVQVLRGPQGTFVGENSTGGAIFVNSHDPDFSGVHGYAQLQAGNYSDRGIQGAINLPIDDAWAARIAFDEEQRDSFFKDIGSASKLTPSPQLFGSPGSLDEKNFRVGLLGNPSENLKVLMKVEVNDKSTGGYAWRPVPGTEYAPYATSEPFTLNYDQNTINDEFSVRPSLRIDWNINGSGIDLRSITGDQFMRVHNLEDSDATSATLATTGLPAQSTSQAIIERPITQEFDLISPTGGRFNWVAGAFYLHDIREVDLDIKSFIPSDVLPDFMQVLQTAAAFGQLSYKITPALELQAGLRYTRDWNEVADGGHVTILGIPGVPMILSNAAGIETDSATTGKVALNWTVNSQNFLYAFVSKGFKAGGFNAASASGPQSNFAPEVVWDYEIGWKGQYFENHLYTTLDGFWDDYRNLQVNALDAATGQASLVNTGKSTIKGGEAELHGQFGGLGIDTGLGYVNSRLGAITLVNTEALPPGVAASALPQCAGGVVSASCFDYGPYTVDLSGSQNPLSPQWTFNAGVQYAIPVGQSGTLTPRINYSYVGPQWTTLFEAPPDYLHSFGLWNATVSYEMEKWQFQAYGLNLADKLYVAGQAAPGTNPDNEELGYPRQFGIRVTRRFGAE